MGGFVGVGGGLHPVNFKAPHKARIRFRIRLSHKVAHKDAHKVRA